MSEPDRTLGNEPKHLRPEIQQILNDVAGTDPADWYRRNEAGIAIESLILEDRKALATALLEKGPENLPYPNREDDPDFYDFQAFTQSDMGEARNEQNEAWRSIIKEHLG